MHHGWHEAPNVSCVASKEPLRMSKPSIMTLVAFLVEVGRQKGKGDMSPHLGCEWSRPERVGGMDESV